MGTCFEQKRPDVSRSKPSNRSSDTLQGKVQAYDVNNEMLHGSFFQDHLGKDIRVNMFKTANQLDPSATLFVNDYHIEDGCDSRSSPEKYIQHILDLQEQGAPVGGIGIQGHIDSPVGPIVCSALDKLGILGLQSGSRNLTSRQTMSTLELTIWKSCSVKLSPTRQWMV
ncbi:UNVERIFIED_CONTAM: Endo-1,4-beta-xylanase 1 [Sesamum angustifolium]|uniref:Endo-1,4-beta-xylanase 1 n=1 Tax=Sesamum angustifolium TaxID=2727405 RepID=A0AAW2RLN5_9LAMI